MSDSAAHSGAVRRDASPDDPARCDAVHATLAGIAAVDPALLVEQTLAGHGFGPRVSLVAVGKAAGAMATAAAEVLGPYLRRGVVIAPTSVVISGAPIVAYRGGHPTPSPEGVRGAEAIYRLVESLDAEDVLLCLVSGGASALMTLPVRGVTLDEVCELTTLLLRVGATIDELNCVRKHLDRLKGGRLAALAFPARVHALVLSDVVGDSLSTIASGPTVPDPTTLDDAQSVLRSYGLWDRVSPSIRDALEQGDESPKPGELRFSTTHTRLIGSNARAAEAAAAHLRARGYGAHVVTTSLTGEARDAGRAIARAALDAQREATQPIALIYGGETTVTVTGPGRGGRNQELALGAALELDGSRGVTVASIGTDGIDGPTDAAGAVADGEVLARARRANVDAAAALAANDAYTFWRAVRGLVILGPTGTNVMDLIVATVEPVTA